MFKFILTLCIKFFSVLQRFIYRLFYLVNIFMKIKITFLAFLNYFYSIFLKSRLLVIFKDLRSFLLNKIAYVWLLVTKHRLFYILRLLFIVFLLYKPVLIDLDSIYWLGSTVFYFFSNNLFFISYVALPGSIGFKTWWFYKVFVIISFFPAFWSARRFKKRLLKRRKLLLGDDDIVSVFKWVQQFFVYSLYYLIFFFLFLSFSFLIPLIYIYLSEVDFVFITSIFLSFFFSSYAYLLLPFSYLYSLNYFFFLSFFYNFIILSFYFLFSYLSFVFFVFSKVLFFLFLLPLTFLLSYFCLYLNTIYSVFIIFLTVLSALISDISSNLFTLKELDAIFDVYKNFLFSDNYLNFIGLILINFFKVVTSFLLNFFILIFSNFSAFIRLILGASLFDLVVINFNIIWSYTTIYFYDKLILILEWVGGLYNLYFSKVSVFGFFSTWYEHLNHNVQKGDSKNSLINWLLLHIYLSIIVFWFLDFDFRVSAKSPPKTPYTLLEEAKKTYDWVPAEMDFGSMQTDHTAVYFALLDISFEHVESLHFVYGDFEYIDEEFDHEDDTPDEEEFWNDSQETTTVREIIDTDISFGRKRHPINAQYNPLNAKTSYERHYLTEIVGEPELMYIEPELKWMYESVYTPSFEELHFKDSLFSEWVFDPDEDLTLFEVLIFFPLFFYLIYVWFYHRWNGRSGKGRHFKPWLRYMVPTRRTIYSGSYIEDLFGISLGNFGRRIFDTMRKYKSPELRVKNFYRLKLQRNNQRLKLLQVESFFFEKLRHKAYKKALKEWEKGLNIGVEFLVPRKRLPQFYTGIKNLKVEMKTWAKLGDWIKFDRFSGEYKYKGGFQRYEHYQYDLPDLLDMYMMKVARIRKRKRFLWRTINKLPGHHFMARKSKFWHSRYGNTEFFFPSRKMKYNYNYYNYIGWRENRTQWRRYAFTPGNVTNKVWALNRDTPEGGYRSFRGYQKRKRLMKSFQF